MKDILAQTVDWFQRAFPKITSKNVHTQLGVHFEEVNEMLMELSSTDFETQIKLDTAKAALHNLATHLKASDNVITISDRVNFLDALCDQVVTAAGCAHVLDLDIVGGMTEVNSSNFSKFVNGQPLYDDNRKVMKGPAYRKADLAPFV